MLAVAGADRLRRRRPAAADLDRHRLRRAHGPDRRARALRPAAGRVPDRHALPRAPALPAALERLPAAPGRALGADRRRRRRRAAAAAASCSRTASSATGPSASSTTTRRSRAWPRCTARSTTCAEVLDDVEPDEVMIAIPSAPGTLRAAVVSACRARGITVRTVPTVFELRADRRPALAPAARRQGRGRAGPRPGADGDRVRRRLPDRPHRARHRRGRLDRLRAVPPDRPREPEHARRCSTTARRTCSRSSASCATSATSTSPKAVLADCKDEERMREVFAELPAGRRLPRRRVQARRADAATTRSRPCATTRSPRAMLTEIAGDYGVQRVRARLDRQGGRARHGHGRVEGAGRVGRRGRAGPLSRRRRSARCASATCSAPRAR